MKAWMLPILFLAPALAGAAEQTFSAVYDQCMNGAESTAAMVDCVSQEAKREDARLNEQYQLAMKALDPSQRTLLRNAQRAWLAYRDADCLLEQQRTGGTIDRVNGPMCILQLTKARADELAGWGQP